MVRPMMLSPALAFAPSCRAKKALVDVTSLIGLWLQRLFSSIVAASERALGNSIGNSGP